MKIVIDMKTNKFWGAAAIGCLMCSGCATQSGNQYTLDGTINGGEGEWIYLAYTVHDTVRVTDSVRIADGAFRFAKELDVPAVEAALYMGKPFDYRTLKMARVFLEPAAMTVALDTADFSAVKVTGSASQTESDSLNAVLSPIYAHVRSLRDSLQTASSGERKEWLTAQADAYADSIRNIQLDFVQSRPHSFVAAGYLPFLMGQMTYADLKAVYENLSPEVKQHANLLEVRKELSVLERVQPGNPAPLFRALSWEGDSIDLADLKGKYVLLDFWATWCVPCRKSFPHVKGLYRKYHAKGFEVFCVADDDSNPDKWKEAIRKDGIEDFHHVLRGLKWDRSKGIDGMDHTNDISDLYAIHYLPTKYLIDKEGNIVGKFDDEELDAKLKEIFGY